MTNEHKDNLYIILLTLSRNIFFYNKIKLLDNFETRIYLMFFHFSIMMIVYKKKKLKFDQKSYDSLFLNIENNLRELGFGDVSVNKKMKEINKILYDILLKIEDDKIENKNFNLNSNLVIKYFNTLKDKKSDKLEEFSSYFVNFFDFCFELSPEIMVRNAIKFKY